MSNPGLTIDDEIFDALADVHRRQLLLELLYQEHQQIAELTGVSREVADADDGLLSKHLAGQRHIPSVDDDLVRMHHIHLPKLAEYGLIEWDRDENVVTKGPRFEDVQLLLTGLERQRDGPQPDVLERRIRRTR